MLVKLSTPEGLVVSLEDVASRLRIDIPEDEQADVERLIRAATSTVEKRTGRVLLPTEFEWRAPSWFSQWRLPVVPVREVTAVAYLDQAHQEQTLPAERWHWERDGRGAAMFYDGGAAEPALSSRELPVRLRFSAGYDDPEDLGVDAELVPEPADTQLVLMLVGHWHRNREASTDATINTVPIGFEDLVALRRIYR